MRLRMPWSSSFRNPWAVFSFTSTNLAVVPSLVWADAVCFSMRSTASAAGCSSARGTAAAATFSTSTSAVCMRAATSVSICFTRTRSSASLVRPRIFDSSCCMLFTLVCSFPSSEPEPEPEIASFFSSAVFCSRHFRATTMLACAARSATLAASTISVRASLIASPAVPRLPSDRVASVIFWISPSAAATFASTSSSMWVRFRSAVVARNCCRRWRPSSRRFWSMSISSFTALAGPSVKRSTSTSFLATKVWASASAACTRATTWSASVMMASRSCPLESPLRKGSSASAIRCSSSSAVLTFSATSRSRLSAAMRTCVSFTVLLTSSSFSCASLPRSCRAFVSSCKGPGMAFSFVPISRVLCVSTACAALSAVSVSLMPSAVSPPSGAVIIAAFSTSISAPASWLESSS
mmetsp:Transcript_71728/g.202506  ORF Transcript_71728/g.202506 Transcript_71728/m.202506 type:complete len:409 (+) Transcript_71728:2977-4203(+)